MATGSSSYTAEKTHQEVEAVLPRRRDGRLKQRYTWEEKTHVLDPRSAIDVTENRLIRFQELFAFRRHRAIITRVHGGPRDWVELKGRLFCDQIVRHLLANRIPHMPPQWIGARSFRTSRFFCLDVDPDRRSENSRGTPTFAKRCEQVHTCLAKLGIDTHNPAEVLIQDSPSGGRHYYVFFGRPFALDQYQNLLAAAGLSFAKGQVEFFPSETQGLRLPFGHVPGRPHDPEAWIRFIDDYHNGRIKQYLLGGLYENLARHKSRTIATPVSKPPASLRPSKGPRSNRAGAPQYRQATVPGNQPASGSADERYRELVERGPASFVEVQELMKHGISELGSRTAILKHLAAHLIFKKGMSAHDAAVELTAWAMNPRHHSEDIQQDLARGTDVVPLHIARMCEWYEKRRDDNRKPTTHDPHNPRFAPDETVILRDHLQGIPEQERRLLADFLLHLLWFARQHGKPAKDGTGWESQPAIRAVVRKWPGCHHMNYKARIEAATKLGLLSMIKGAWHNPKGKGRARTYLLAVPIVAGEHQVLTYGEAKTALMTAALDHSGRMSESREIPTDNQNIRTDNHDFPIENHDIAIHNRDVYKCPTKGEYSNARERNDPDAPLRGYQPSRWRPAHIHPPSLCPGRTGTPVDPRPRNSTPTADATKGLRHSTFGAVQSRASGSTSTPAAGDADRDIALRLRIGDFAKQYPFKSRRPTGLARGPPCESNR